MQERFSSSPHFISIKIPNDVYGTFDSFEKKMDNAIGGFDILDESPAAAATVLVDVKSGRFPPHFDNSCSN